MSSDRLPDRPTIYDVARLAGVSASTVSRALSGAPRVHEDTVRRVRRAAERLHYRTNLYARALHTGRSHTLGLVLPDIANPAFAELIQGAERRAASAGYTLVVADSQESQQAEVIVAHRLAATVDGLILATPRSPDAQVQGVAESIPTVVLNRRVPGVRSLVVDLAPGISSAVDEVAAFGHALALYAPGPPDAWMTRERQTVLQMHCEERGITLLSLAAGVSSVERGRSLVPAVQASGAGIVLCFSDLLGIGILLESRDRGISIPDAFSVVGYDDAAGAMYTSPSLSTISAPVSVAADAAVGDLLMMLDGDALSEQAASPPTEYISRGSTGAVGGRAAGLN